MIRNFFRNLLSSKAKFKEFHLIESDTDVSLLIKFFKKEKTIGIDTEFDWRNTYYPKLSLLQISFRDIIFIIDCIKCKNLSFLKNYLEDKNFNVIIHSSRSDCTVLSTNLNIKIKKAYDIQVAEKFINGGNIKNYGSIVNKYFNIRLDKNQTNSNWLKRPFSKNQLSYAAEDVNFLIEIYQKQLKLLKKLGKVKEVYRESINEIKKGNQDLIVSRLSKLKKTSRKEKEVFLWREKEASIHNVPTSYIFRNNELPSLVLALAHKSNLEKKLFKILGNDEFVDSFMKKFL